LSEQLPHAVLIIPAAIILDLLLGDPRWLPHPVVLIGRFIKALEGALRKVIRNERLAGVLLLVLTVGCTWGGAFLLLQGVYAIHPWLGTVVATLFSWTCLAARSLHRESQLAADALLRGDIPEARRYLSYIVGRDTAELDEPEIWRGVLETVAENTSDGVIAPLLFLMIGGAPLGLTYKAVNTLDSMVGYKNERYRLFGWAAARFDDLVNLVPARLTGILMVMAAPLTGLSGVGACKIMLRDGGNHASPNSGIPEAAAAGALGIRLGGANRYFGKIFEKPTIGDPIRPLDHTAYRGVLRLMYGAEAGLFAAWLLLRLF